MSSRADNKMDDVTATIIVHSARGLLSKRHQVCHASVIFGVGKVLFATEVVESNDPKWRQEATFDVTKLQKERFKFKIKDKDHTIGVVKVPVASLTTASQTAWFPLVPHKRSSEAHGELQVEYRASAPFKAEEPAEEEEEEGSNSVPVVEDVVERAQLGSGLKDYFKRSMPVPQQQKTAKEEDLLHTLRRTAQHCSDSELHMSHNPPSIPKGSTTPDLCSRSNRERRRVSFSPRDSALRFSWTSQSPPLGSLPGSQARLPEEGGGTDYNVPEVTGISPREASLEGGQRITLRGSNLGLSLEDVVKVTVVDMDCTDSVEYVSSDKLTVTTKVRSSPARGFVVVETASGGQGQSTVEFSFLDPELKNTDNPPEVSGISPREVSLIGGERVTLRGSYLGQSVQDVYKVMLVDVDCTESVEYISPDKLIVTAPARNAPATGTVVVDTVSGGHGESSVEFSYVDPSVEHAEKRVDGVFGLSQLLPWKQKPMDDPEVQQEFKQRNTQLRELKTENTLLKANNALLKEHVDRLVVLLLEHKPDLLHHNLLHPSICAVDTDGMESEP